MVVFEFLPSNNRPVFSFFFGFYPYKRKVVHQTVNVKWNASYFSHFLETIVVNILQQNITCIPFATCILFFPYTKYVANNIHWKSALGFSYRASSIHVTIRITNRCDSLYYVFISFFSSLPYMFRAFMSPSSGVFQAVVFMLPFGSCSALLIVCVRQRTGADARRRSTKHCMNQMVA